MRIKKYAQGVMATNRKGAPLPFSIFMGKAKIIAPVAGNWSKFREYPHMQEIGAKWRELIKRDSPPIPAAPRNFRIVPS